MVKGGKIEAMYIVDKEGGRRESGGCNWKENSLINLLHELQFISWGGGIERYRKEDRG